jgi:hypothetical protein
MGSVSIKTLRAALLALSFVITMVISATSVAQNKKKVNRKVQEVNFSEMSLKGTVRNPDGAFLVQKKGIKFLPLHDVQKDMDSRIREASFYVR